MKQKKTTVPTGCFYVYWMRPKYFPFSLTPHTHQFFFCYFVEIPICSFVTSPRPTTYTYYLTVIFFYIFPPTVYVCCMLDTPQIDQSDHEDIKTSSFFRARFFILPNISSLKKIFSPSHHYITTSPPSHYQKGRSRRRRIKNTLQYKKK